MGKIFAQQFAIGFLIWLISSVVGSIISFLVVMIFRSPLAGLILAMIVAVAISIFFCLCVVQGDLFVSGVKKFGMRKYFFEKDDTVSSFWTKCITEKRKISMKQIFCLLLPFLIIGIVCLALLIIFCKELLHSADEALVFFDATAKFGEDATKMLLAMVRLTLLGVSPIVWVSYWLGTLIAFHRRKCKRCGAILSYVKVGDGRHFSYQETKTKTRDTYGVIGSLYTEDGKKVKDIMGDTGTQKFEKTISLSGAYANCCCVYCENKQQMFDYGIRSSTEWQRK